MQTYSPIVSHEDYHCGFFISIPEPKQLQEVCVLTGGRKPPLVIRQGDTHQIKEIQQGKYTRLIRVDKSEHQIETEFSATDEAGVYVFNVQLTACCKVVNPVVVCEENVTDAAQCLNSLLKSAVASIARDSSMEQWKEFEAKLKNEYGEANQAEETRGLQFSNLFVTVTADQEWQELQRAKVRIRGQGELKATEIDESNKLSRLPVNAATGAFSGVLAGTLTLEEAHDRLEQKDSAGFDEAIRRFEKLRAEYKAMVDDGLLSEAAMTIFMEKEIKAFSARFPATSMGKGRPAAALADGIEVNPYAPRDEDELE